MDTVTAIAFLRGVILERFPPGPERERWLAWLIEFSQAEETFQAFSGLLISQSDVEPSRMQ